MKLKHRLIIFILFYLLLIGGTVVYYIIANDISVLLWVLFEIITIYLAAEYV